MSWYGHPQGRPLPWDGPATVGAAGKAVIGTITGPRRRRPPGADRPKGLGMAWAPVRGAVCGPGGMRRARP
ncbi:hypothetical protein GCM10017562_07900 [Streptomyces roseofulvus]